MASDLEKKITNQIEYYFGDINLPRDKFLQEKIKDDDGWITLEVLLSFKRLANLSTDVKVIADAVEKSDHKLVIVSEDRLKLKRNPIVPLPELNEERKKELTQRTAYAKGFPTSDTLDDIVKFLEEHGTVESCQRRTFLDRADKSQKFKGSCFIIFKTVDECKKFIEAESIKYKEVELIRKWQEKYFEGKKQEVEERRNKRKGKEIKDESEDTKEKEKERTLAPGTVVSFVGIKDEEVLTREEIKSKVEELTKAELSYIDYNKGWKDGHLRFEAENAASEFYEKLTDGKLSIGDIELTFKVLDADELGVYLKKMLEGKRDGRRDYKNKKKFGGGGRFNNRKRKGNFGNDGPRSKK